MDLQTINFKADSTEIEQATHRIEQLDDTMTKAEKTIIQQNAKMAILRGQAVQLKDGIVDLGSGFTQSQAKMLANLATLDATGEELKQLATSLKEFNAISGTNPFDKSIGGVEKLRREIAELTNVNKLMQQGYSLTRDEIVNLSRDSERLTQIMKAQGAETLEISAALRNLTTETVFLAKKRDELAAQSVESNRRAQEEARKALELEKQRVLVNNKLMQDWAGGVGQRSPTQESMSSFYKQQSVEAERNAELQKKFANEAAIAQQRSSDSMFRNQQLRLSQEQAIYKQGMSDLAEYYSNLEKLDKQAESQRKQSFDRMIEINRLKQEQDRREYEKSMRDMREYYSEMEKQNAPAVGRRGTEGDMDSAVTQFRQAQAKATREAAKANDYLIDAERRLAVALDETNSGLSERYTDRLNKYQKALEKSGAASDVATAKMANFRKGIDQLQAKQRAEELNYLSRAMSVQMGDVAISLASGMNPLLVMIQQGDQIRGVLEQVDVKGKELSTAMNNAAAQIARGFVDTGKAIGGFFLGAVESAGKAVIDFLVAPFDFAVAAINRARTGTDNVAESLIRLKESTIAFAKVGLVALVVGLVAAGKALFDMAKEQDKVVIALNRTGAALGMTKQQAIDFTNSFNNISSSKASESLAAIAASGKFTSDSIRNITESAVALEKFAGVAIADTVKNFEKLKEKPSEALMELAAGTGYLTTEVLKQIQAHESNGNKALAAAMAMEEYGRISRQVSADIEQDLSTLAKSWINIKEATSLAWDEFKNSSVVEGVVTAFKGLASILNGLAFVMRLTALGIQQIYSLIASPWNFKEITAEVSKATDDLISAHSKISNAIWNNTNVENVNRLTESQKQANAQALSYYEIQKKIADKIKGTTPSASDAKSEGIGKGAWVSSKIQDLVKSEGTVLSPENFSAAIKKFSEEYDKATVSRKRLTDAQREAKAVDNEFNRELEKAKDLRIQVSGAQVEQTKSMRALQDLQDNPRWTKFTEDERQRLTQIYEQAHAIELLTIEEATMAKYRERINSQTAESIKLQESYTNAQKLALDIFNDPAFAKLSDQRKTEIADALALAHAEELVAKARASVKSETEKLTENRRSFEAQKERSQFEFGLSGTPSQNREEMAKFDVRQAAMKDIEDTRIRMTKAGNSDSEISDQIQKIQTLYDEKEAWVAIEEQQKRVQQQSEQMADIFGDAFSDLIKGGKSFGDVLEDLTGKIVNMAMEIMIMEPLKASLTGMFKGAGGMSGMFGSLFGGFFAEGGDPPVGKISMVGEKGPELFVPKTAGTIIPNKDLVGGGTNVTQNVVFNISAPNGNVSKESLSQIQTAMGAATQRALRRNS